MELQVKVGMAELHASSDALLVCHGLGSCVALLLWDPEAKVGGMAHVMLPDSAAAPSRLNLGGPARYADLALPALLMAMAALGGEAARMEARLIGGATMFSALMSRGVSPIGERNLGALRSLLQSTGIALVAEDSGGTWGRSVEFNTRDGQVTVRVARHALRSS